MYPKPAAVLGAGAVNCRPGPRHPAVAPREAGNQREWALLRPAGYAGLSPRERYAGSLDLQVVEHLHDVVSAQLDQ